MLWREQKLAAELDTPSGERSTKSCQIIAQALAAVPGTQVFDEKARIFIAQQLTTSDYSANSKICDIGDIGTTLYIVLKGRLSVQVWSSCSAGHTAFGLCNCDDRDAYFTKASNLDPGSSFGEVALQSEERKERVARVMTLKDTTFKIKGKI